MDAGINFGDVMLSSLYWNKSSLWKSLFKIMLAIHRILILNEQVKGVLDSEVTIFLDHLSCFWKQLWPSRMHYSLWQVPSESSSCVLPVTAKSVNDFSAKMPNQTLAEGYKKKLPLERHYHWTLPIFHLDHLWDISII